MKITPVAEPRLQFRPRFDKIVDLLVYLAHIKPSRDQYQCVKLFYLADKEHLNRFGRPITFDVYYAFDYGPVASTVLDLIKGYKPTLDEVGITELPIVLEKKEKILTLESPARAVDYDLFSKSDILVFSQIVEEFGEKSFGDLYKLTHSHFAYKRAWENKPKNASRALMFYEDMIDDGPTKSELLHDLEPAAQNMV